ncbi:hypothetical protein BDR07DRAFT_1462727 [Suillus spraguei]|nr:hypothetical protein BDR07DRAFT_1462727 [Suillus spraguei]
MFDVTTVISPHRQVHGVYKAPLASTTLSRIGTAWERTGDGDVDGRDGRRVSGVIELSVLCLTAGNAVQYCMGTLRTSYIWYTSSDCIEPLDFNAKEHSNAARGNNDKNRRYDTTHYKQLGRSPDVIYPIDANDPLGYGGAVAHAHDYNINRAELSQASLERL